jgi:hypothetical protein
VEKMIPAGDVDVGQGGLIFTVCPAFSDAPEQERPVKLTAEVRLHRRGRDAAR